VVSNVRWAWLPVIALAIPTTAHAQADDSAVAAFAQCAAIQVDADRLACFDRVTREVRASAAAAAGQSAKAKIPGRREREDFGLTDVQREKKQPEQAKKLKELTVRVAASRKFGAGYYAIMLEDGAIWQTEELDPYLRPPGSGDTVRIRRGMMGGYLLRFGDQPAIRVRRIS
jgi:hypothetical protein